MNYPEHWSFTTFGSVNEGIDKSGPEPTETFDYIEISSIDRDLKKITDVERISAEDASSRAKYHLESGDLLISKVRPKLNGVAVVPEKYHGAIGTTGFYVVRSNSVDSKFLYYYCQSADFIDSMDRKATGSSYPSVKISDIETYEVPVPSKKEQEDIVAKIEELFSKLDSGIKEIQTANTRLKQYERTILQNAVEGELTENWRMDQEDIEPTNQLLQRTEKLRENECGGKYGKLIEHADIPDGIELPEDWAWTSLSQIGEVSRGKSTHRPRDDPSLFGGEYPFVQTGEVRAANTILNNYEQTYNEKGLEQSRLWPEGTLCITIAANIGETAILGIDACFPDSVVGFLTNPEYCNVQYVELYFRTIQRDLERYAPATAQKNINLGTLSDLPIPLPPIKEQNQIVQQVHSGLSVLTNNMKTISNELVRSDRLRQSILKKAFRGELVSQNQYDDSEESRLKRTSSEFKPESQKQATLSEVTNDVE